MTWYYCIEMARWISSCAGDLVLCRDGLFFSYDHQRCSEYRIYPVSEVKYPLALVLDFATRNVDSLENAKKAGLTRLTKDKLVETGFFTDALKPADWALRIFYFLYAFNLPEEQFIAVMPSLGPWVSSMSNQQLMNLIEDQLGCTINEWCSLK